MKRELFNARVVFTTITRLAGIYMAEPPAECNPTPRPVDMVLDIYKARRGEENPEDVVRMVSCALAKYAGDLDLSKIGLSTLTKSLGFHRLASLLYRLSQQGDDADLVRSAVSVVAGEVSSPCHADPALESEAERVEKRMKLYGVVLGISLPLLFVLTLYASAAIGIVAIIAAAGLWLLIRKDGRVFQFLQVELAWRKCSLDPRVVRALLEGRSPMPSVFEILGIPPPRLD
ncbi:MAG: hypothetical protein GSR73_00840 [Desulfurococcales archaeon]|nr:hypothetical protein [Desulfurococcales archaeon]